MTTFIPVPTEKLALDDVQTASLIVHNLGFFRRTTIDTALPDAVAQLDAFLRDVFRNASGLPDASRPQRIKDGIQSLIDGGFSPNEVQESIVRLYNRSQGG